MVINSDNYNAVFCYKAKSGNLIQSCEVISENIFAFSCGLSTYVVGK